MALIESRTRAALDGSAFVAWMLPPSSARPARAQGTMTITTETITRRRGVARLARQLGRSHGHVSRILSGQRKPGKALRDRLARLGVQVGTGEARDQAPMTAAATSRTTAATKEA